MSIDGKTVGDVDYDAVKDIASAITPVPGGVGLCNDYDDARGCIRGVPCMRCL